MELKPVLRALVQERADLCRGLLMVVIFRPVAYVLPLRLVWVVAVGVAAVMVVLQSAGRRLARDLATSFGVPWGTGLRMAIRSHAKRFNEFALQVSA